MLQNPNFLGSFKNLCHFLSFFLSFSSVGKRDFRGSLPKGTFEDPYQIVSLFFSSVLFWKKPTFGIVFKLSLSCVCSLPIWGGLLVTQSVGFACSKSRSFRGAMWLWKKLPNLSCFWPFATPPPALFFPCCQVAKLANKKGKKKTRWNIYNI